MPATRPPLRRIIWTMERLKRGAKMTTEDLARQFEVSPRTAFRDLSFLRDQCRAPIDFDRGRESYVLTEPTYELPIVTMTRGELLALFFAEMAARQYRGTPYERDLQAALSKIQEYLSESITIEPNPLSGFLSLDLGPLSAPDPVIFVAIVEALQRRRRIRVRYTSLSRGRTTGRAIEPYHVYNLQGVWYVAAYDPTHRSVRDFALHRVHAATVLDEPYVIDPRFNFGEYMGESLFIEKGANPTEVVIRFGPRQARWIRERKWHKTARIQDSLDGGCVLRIKVAGLGEVRRWIMQFGSEAEVLEPESLRREVANEIETAFRFYRK
jgi:predicted DNA-binding transcriptional regulator YafY